jgi:hypothetical protein
MTATLQALIASGLARIITQPRCRKHPHLDGLTRKEYQKKYMRALRAKENPHPRQYRARPELKGLDATAYNREHMQIRRAERRTGE